MLAATFTLTNCAEEIDAPVQEPSASVPFEIVASTVDTKTANDGLNTVWVEGDAINLFHAEAGSTANYVNNNSFAVTDLETGLFEGTLTSNLTEGVSYDWYAMYPYSKYVEAPNGIDYSYVGNRNGVTQNGYNSKAHLSGSNCSLYGVVKSVAAGERPVVTMHHLTSVIAITINNVLENTPLTVTSVSFTAPEDIVGSYYIDFASDQVSYTGSGESYVSSTASATVTNGTELNYRENATVYIPIKPFTAKAGDVLKISVNGYEKELELESDVEFVAGNIKPMTFYYDKEPSSTSVTWDLTEASYVSSSADEVEWTSEHVNLLLVKDASSSPANNYLGGTNAHTRVYKNQIMTFTPSSGFVIERIEFVSTTSSYASNLVNSTWSNATAVASGSTITVTPANGYTPISVTIGTATRFTSITVYGSYDEDYVPPTLESIAVSNPTTEFRQNDDFAFGGVVTATYSDESTAVVTTAATFSGYDLATVGTQTVTVTYTEGEVTATTTYEIEVVAAQTEPTSLVSVTVQEFIASEVSETVWYKLTGEIVSIANSTYGNFTIKDETGEVYIYGMTNGWVGENDKSFAAIGLKVGDVVTLGTLRGAYNSTPQGGGNDYPAYYISHDSRCVTPYISVSNNIVEITCATDGATIYYTTNGDVPTTSSSVYTEAFEIEATVTVKTFAVCDGYLDSAVAELECVWVDPDADQPTTADATLTFDDTSKRTVGTTSQQVWAENGITFTNDKASSSSNVNTSYYNPVRLYAGSSILVEKENMTKIIFDCNSSDYATDLSGSIGTVSGTTVTVASDKVTIVFSSPVNSFSVAKLTAQVRMDAVTVTYQVN